MWQASPATWHWPDLVPVSDLSKFSGGFALLLQQQQAERPHITALRRRTSAVTFMSRIPCLARGDRILFRLYPDIVNYHTSRRPRSEVLHINTCSASPQFAILKSALRYFTA